MEGAPAAFVRQFSPDQAGAIRRPGPPLDPQPRPGRARLAAAPDGARPRLTRGVLRRRASGPATLDRRPGWSRSRPGPWPSILKSDLRPPPADAGRRLLLLAAVVGRGLQAAEPVPALGRRATTPWTSACGTPCGPAQLVVPLDTHIIRVGTLPRADPAGEPRLGHGPGRDPRHCAGCTPTTRCATTSRCAISAWAARAASAPRAPTPSAPCTRCAGRSGGDDNDDERRVPNAGQAADAGAGARKRRRPTVQELHHAGRPPAA